ncbi:cadherin-like protein 26 isoform 2-T2 [Polymixia lowei]
MEIIPISLLITLCLGIHRSSSDILQRQKRNWIIDSFTIVEENEGPFPYVLDTIELETKLGFFNLRGQGVDEDPMNILQINDKTGEITVHGKVDYEQYEKLKLTFEALDKNNVNVETRLGVEVQILDINDNAPIFENKEYVVHVDESDQQGIFLAGVKAIDKDSSRTNNGTFDFTIVSVTPKPTDLEFYLKQNDDIATIGFKGCLDYKKADKYIILVEAKDRGDKIQLSSTCTVIINVEGGNNHVPVFTGQTGPGSIKEREENVLVLRLQVTDKDPKGTAAWRAKYKILGDTNNNFEISTDAQTNDGLLYVKKPLDYEAGPLRNLSVTVENEIPYHSCKVQKRSSGDRWDLVIVTGKPGTGMVPPLSTRQVTVNVEDVNDPPYFSPSEKYVSVEENIAVGYYLEKFTAKDMDGTYANKFVYIKGEDPGDWVTVDSNTGSITTAKILDRESPLVMDDIYNVTMLAVDNGEPPLTSTATLSIHLRDQNDNLPNLNMSSMDMCLSDTPSRTTVTAFDLDKNPYGGPFRFKLHGNVKGQWSVNPDHGYSVSLVKEKTVHAGYHKLQLEISDLQGQSAVYNLSVAVCNCLKTTMAEPNCRSDRLSSSRVAGATFGICIAAILLLLGFILLALLLSCEKGPWTLPGQGIADEHLNVYNTECVGTDCKVDLTLLKPSNQEVDLTLLKPLNQGEWQKWQESQTAIKVGTTNFGAAGSNSYDSMFPRNSVYRSSTTSKYATREDIDYLTSREDLLNMLHQRMYTIHVSGEELGDYDPYPYAEEGDPHTSSQLDPISIPEIPFDTDILMHLGPKFNTLASVCLPDAMPS